MVEKNNDSDSVIAGARRNCMLSWRPDLVQGKFVRADSQKWCQDADGSVKYPEGSHRMRDDWKKDRYEFLTPEGKPVVEDWSRSSSCQEVNKMDEPESMKEFEDIIIPNRFTTDHEVLIGARD